MVLQISASFSHEKGYKNGQFHNYFLFLIFFVIL